MGILSIVLNIKKIIKLNNLLISISSDVDKCFNRKVLIDMPYTD